MNDDNDDQDLRDTYKADASGVRGLHKDRDAIERLQKFKKDLKLALQRKDKRAFMSAIRAYGAKDGTPEFQKWVAVWDDMISRL